MDYSRTVAVNTLVVSELFYSFNCKRIMEAPLGKVWIKLEKREEYAIDCSRRQ